MIRQSSLNVEIAQWHDDAENKRHYCRWCINNWFPRYG